MTLKYIYIFSIFFVFLFLTGFQNKDEVSNKNNGVIKFSHKFHKELTDCADCHSNVKNSESLNDNLLPTKEDCKSCHDTEDANNCSQCHFENIQKLIKKDSELIFNHKFHTENNTQCEDCHQKISEVDYSFESSNANPKMEKCYSCHRETEIGNTKIASNNCEVCHKTTENLFPENHKVEMFDVSHKFIANKQNSNCAMCHDDNSCDNCHISTTGINEANRLNHFFILSNPRKINKVHDLNFQYTHGLETSYSRCQSCHESESFCQDCHTSQNVIPTSHSQFGFALIDGNGGEHSLLAKRNITTCIACHNVDFGDPTCVRCHSQSFK